MNSIYITTIRDMAKKRSMPVKDLIDQLSSLGLEYKSNTKLTQVDLDAISEKLNGKAVVPKVEEKKERVLTNPNVLIVKTGNTFTVMLVDTKVSNDGVITNEIIESVVESRKGDALLEYRRLRGMNNVENI